MDRTIIKHTLGWRYDAASEEDIAACRLLDFMKKLKVIQGYQIYDNYSHTIDYIELYIWRRRG